MPQIAEWLEKLGMSEYAQHFAENRIDFSVLPDLTDQDLKDLGVVLGDRRKILRAIAGLKSPEAAAPSPATDAVIARPQDAAERRQVTVMFSDLVGSTALSARMDPEDLREVISVYQKCVADTVQRFGGFVAKYMGDGVLIYFGYPQAYEDDAERAVRAGLELVAAVGGLKTHAPLQTRVGIATGLVIVGDLIGSGASQEQAIVGETPNLAARLQGVAEPNSVVFAESTRKLVGNLFELEDLGRQNLKGIEGHVRAWAALRPSSVESRFDALHAGELTQFVGREEELELLLRRWSKAKAGEGQVVLLSGEPGIGKSRLTAALTESLANEPHTRLRYFCSPQHTDRALFPIISQMERAAGFAHNDSAHAKLDKLDAFLAQNFTPPKDAALLAEMLSLPNDGRYPVLELAPQQRRQKTLEALTAQLEALSKSRPVLMIFEDVHWIDPTSLETLGRSVNRLKTLGVLLIVTFRPEFEPPWIGSPYVTARNINRLGGREIAAMIDSVTGNKLVSVSIRQDIIERTDGIPLFIEEMTKAVLEAGGEEAAQQAASAVPSPSVAVPASLHASLMARLDRLGPAKEVAQIGAAIGREFSHALLEAVTGKPKAELASALDRLMHAGLLFRQGVPPHASYLFKHALVQDAAYGTLLRSQRLQMHVLIVTILEKQFSEIVEAQPEQLARHCAEARLVEKAVGYFLKAGQQALQRSAMAEAAAQFRKGLEVLCQAPDGTARQEQELDLQILLGKALIATEGYSAPQPGEAYARARQLCEQLDKPKQLGRILYGQFVFRCVRGELDQAEVHAQDIQRFADTHKEVRWKQIGAACRGLISTSRGKFVDARAYYESALSFGQPSVEMTIHFSRTLLCLGYVDQGTLWRGRALAQARQSSPFNLAYALDFALFFDWMLAEVDRARAALLSAEELIAISNEHGFPLWLAAGKAMRGWSLGALGHPAEGVPLIREGATGLQFIGQKWGLPTLHMILAQTYERAQQYQEALNQLGEATKLIEATEERWVEAELYRQRGALLLLSLHQHAAAEESYRHAFSIARRQGAKFWELRAAMSLARLWRDQGKVQQALELLAPVYGWFTEGFDTRDLKEAKALLEELS
jgi:class 3 adenylate cyclase/predicted ATPase